MKLSKSHLRKIIKEELKSLLENELSAEEDDLGNNLITAIIAKFDVTEEEAEKVVVELEEIVYWIRKGGIQ